MHIWLGKQLCSHYFASVIKKPMLVESAMNNSDTPCQTMKPVPMLSDSKKMRPREEPVIRTKGINLLPTPPQGSGLY